MRKSIYFMLFLASFVVSSCERLVTDIDPPKVKPELVLLSCLSPENSEVKAELSWTRPVFGANSTGDINYITTAKVWIEEENGPTDTLKFNATLKAYFSNSNFEIKPGKKYTVVANYQGLRISGVTTVPAEAVKIDALSYQSVPGEFEGERNLRFITEWVDPGNQDYFYRTYTQTGYSFNRSDTSFSQICSKYFSNKSKRGQRFLATCESSWYVGGTGNSLNFYCFLVTCDKAYFEYHQRRENYFGEDPFSEPFQQFSNVTGGIGLVGSYRTFLKVQTIK